MCQPWGTAYKTKTPTRSRNRFKNCFKILKALKMYGAHSKK